MAVLLSGVLVAGVSACGGSSASSAGNSSTASNSQSFLPASLKGSAPSSVKIGFSGGFGLTNIPVLAALGLGYYNQVASRFHTNISVDIFGGSSELQPALLGGSVQFGVASITGAIPEIAHGEKEVDVLNESVGLDGDLTGPSKFKSRGSNVKPYANSTWCQLSATGTSDATARIAAALAGLKFSSLKMVDIGSSAAVVPSLVSGQCSIVGADVNSTALGMDEGETYMVQNYNEPLPSVRVAGEIVGNVICSVPSFVKQYPQLTQAFVDATIKGLLYVQAHLSDDQTLYAAMPASYKQTTSLGVFSETWSLTEAGFTKQTTAGEFSPQMAFDTIWDGEALQALPHTAISPGSLITNKYVLQAYKDLGEALPTGPITGPAQLPQALGKPSAQAAKLIAILTGKAAPASDGNAPMLAIAKDSAANSGS
jgi:ABC-type nitrate/sulfonate/bicarbonate transport system substrate-binding protein